MVTLVTGATGFIGGRLARRLIERGERVRVLARDARRAAPLEALGADIVQGDLLDPATLAPAVAGCGRIYHVAAQMLAGGPSRADYRRSNADATGALIEAALAGGGVTRFVHTSSAGVYGRIHAPVDEDSPVSPTSAYRESKLLAERACRDAMARHGLPAVIARISPVIGPGSKNYLGLARSIAGGSFRLIGDGCNHDHITPVDDIVEGLILCGESPAAAGETFIIAGDTRTTTAQIVAWFAEALGAAPPLGRLPRWPYAAYVGFAEKTYRALRVDVPFHYRYAFFVADKTLSNARAKRVLGYAPKVQLRDAIHQTVAQYRRDGLI